MVRTTTYIEDEINQAKNSSNVFIYVCLFMKSISFDSFSSDDQH